MKQLLTRSVAFFACAFAATAAGQVRIGVTVSATGPAASLGIPERNTVGMCAKEVAGKTIEYIVLDDASDTTTAVQNTRKLIGESKVDAIIGSTTTPNSLAMLDVFAAEVDKHPVREGERRDGSRRVRCVDNIRQSGCLADENGLIGKRLAAGDVIAVVVAVHHIAHGLVREFGDFRPQPGRRFGADRIRDDYAFGGREENGLMKLMTEEIHIIGQLGDLIVGM